MRSSGGVEFHGLPPPLQDIAAFHLGAEFSDGVQFE